MFSIYYKCKEGQTIRFGNILMSLTAAACLEEVAPDLSNITITIVDNREVDSLGETSGFNMRMKSSLIMNQGVRIIETKCSGLELFIPGKKFTLTGSDYEYVIEDDAKFIKYLKEDAMLIEDKAAFQKVALESENYDLHDEVGIKYLDKRFLERIAPNSKGEHHARLAAIGLKEVEKAKNKEDDTPTPPNNNPGGSDLGGGTGAGTPPNAPNAGLFQSALALCKKHYVLSTVAVCALGLVACYAAFDGKINVGDLLQKTQKTFSR